MSAVMSVGIARRIMMASPNSALARPRCRTNQRCVHVVAVRQRHSAPMKRSTETRGVSCQMECTRLSPSSVSTCAGARTSVTRREPNLSSAPPASGTIAALTKDATIQTSDIFVCEMPRSDMKCGTKVFMPNECDGAEATIRSRHPKTTYQPRKTAIRARALARVDRAAAPREIKNHVDLSQTAGRRTSQHLK